MKYLFLSFLLFVTILVESSVTTLPFLVTCVLLFYIFERKSWVIFFAFFAGVFFDLLTLLPLGQTSLFFVIFAIFITAYQRKFEIMTAPFVFFASFFGSLFFLIFAHASLILLQAFFQAGLSASLFLVVTRTQHNRVSNTLLYKKDSFKRV